MGDPTLTTLFDQIGKVKIKELVRAFYPKVYADPDLSPLFEGDMKEIMRKQQMFLTQFTGGPPLYSQEFGSPAMRQRHLPFEITAKTSSMLASLYERILSRSRIRSTSSRKTFYNRLEQVAAIMVNTA